TASPWASLPLDGSKKTASTRKPIVTTAEMSVTTFSTGSPQPTNRPGSGMPGGAALGAPPPRARNTTNDATANRNEAPAMRTVLTTTPPQRQHEQHDGNDCGPDAPRDVLTMTMHEGLLTACLHLFDHLALRDVE